jgi:hypothetical protein
MPCWFNRFRRRRKRSAELRLVLPSIFDLEGNLKMPTYTLPANEQAIIKIDLLSKGVTGAAPATGTTATVDNPALANALVSTDGQQLLVTPAAGTTAGSVVNVTVANPAAASVVLNLTWAAAVFPPDALVLDVANAVVSPFTPPAAAPAAAPAA